MATVTNHKTDAASEGGDDRARELADYLERLATFTAVVRSDWMRECAELLRSIRTPAASEGEDGAGISFASAEALADWLETLHETDGPAVMCGKWEPAQVAARAIREHLTRPAAQVAAPPKHDERSEAFKMLVAVARAAHRAMDSGEEFADHRVMLEASGATELAHALDAMDALPDVPDPNYVYDGWARAEYFATQPAARRVSGEGVTVDPSPVRDFPEAHVVRFRVGARVFCIGDVFYTKEAAEKMAEAFRADLESFAQPAARRVTDDPRVAELIEAVEAFKGLPDVEFTAASTDEAACDRLDAALESFAQPAEGAPTSEGNP